MEHINKHFEYSVKAPEDKQLPKQKYDVVDRIKILIDKNNISSSQFAAKVGIARSNLTKWQNMERGQRNLSLNTLRKIAEAYNVSISWLQNGDSSEPLPDKYGNVQLCSIPCYEVAAGAGETYAPSYEEMTDLKTINYPVADIERHNTKGSNCFCMLVKGDSMEPTLNDGDKIIVDKIADNNIIDGQIYVFNYGDYVRVKRLSKIIDGILISSDNPKYATEKIVGEHDGMKFNVIGRVIERMGRVD